MTSRKVDSSNRRPRRNYASFRRSIFFALFYYFNFWLIAFCKFPIFFFSELLFVCFAWIWLCVGCSFIVRIRIFIQFDIQFAIIATRFFFVRNADILKFVSDLFVYVSRMSLPTCTAFFSEFVCFNLFCHKLIVQKTGTFFVLFRFYARDFHWGIVRFFGRRRV